MNKKIRNILTAFFFLFFTIRSTQASLLWPIDYGVNQYRKNNLKITKEYFIDYIKSNPNDEDGYYWLAKTYFDLKDIEKANSYFKKAYELSLKEKNIEKIDFNINATSNLEDYFDMAAMYFETGDLKESNAYADLMLKINPKSPSAYFIKAKIAQLEGNIDEATEYLNKAIIFNNKLINTKLAKTLNIDELPQTTLEMYEIFALEAYFSNDLDSAIRYCKKYLDINPANIDITNLLIDLYIKNNELTSAQSLIDKVLSENINVQTLLYKAKIQAIKKEGNYETTLLNAYRINPNNSNVLLELGNYYLKNKNYTKSKKYFEILINVNDAFYEGYFGYIYSLLELEEVDLAIELIRKFISLNPDASEGDYLLAKICEKKGNLKEASQYLTTAIEKAYHSDYFLKRAEINYKLKEYQEAINDLKIAHKLPNAKENDITDALIKNYLKNNDIMNARILLNKKTILDKNRIIYKYNLYVIYKLQNNERMALNQLEEIKKIKPVSIQDYLDMSEIYLEEARVSEAINILNKGIKKYPQDFCLYSKKAKILISLNKINEAKELFAKFDKNND